jgi:hypothetical protein
MHCKSLYSFLLKVASTSMFSRVETLKREGHTKFSRTLGGSYGSAEVEELVIRDENWWILVQWVLSRNKL